MAIRQSWGSSPGFEFCISHIGKYWWYVLVYTVVACMRIRILKFNFIKWRKKLSKSNVFCHQNCFQLKKCSTYTSIYPISTKRCFGISMCSKNSASWFSQNEILTRGSVKNWCYSTENPEIEWETIPWCKKYKQYIVNIKAFIYCICSMLYIHSIQYTVYCTVYSVHIYNAPSICNKVIKTWSCCCSIMCCIIYSRVIQYVCITFSIFCVFIIRRLPLKVHKQANFRGSLQN